MSLFSHRTFRAAVRRVIDITRIGMIDVSTSDPGFSKPKFNSQFLFNGSWYRTNGASGENGQSSVLHNRPCPATRPVLEDTEGLTQNKVVNLPVKLSHAGMEVRLHRCHKVHSDNRSADFHRSAGAHVDAHWRTLGIRVKLISAPLKKSPSTEFARSESIGIPVFCGSSVKSRCAWR